MFNIILIFVIYFISFLITQNNISKFSLYLLLFFLFISLSLFFYKLYLLSLITLLVYSGSCLILFAFSIMLIKINDSEKKNFFKKNFYFLIGILLNFFLKKKLFFKNFRFFTTNKVNLEKNLSKIILLKNLFFLELISLVLVLGFIIIINLKIRK
ncbi:MAG: NADH-quinone oxidoreductase subunit J [Enterobacteriaceae bacterium]